MKILLLEKLGLDRWCVLEAWDLLFKGAPPKEEVSWVVLVNDRRLVKKVFVQMPMRYFHKSKTVTWDKHSWLLILIAIATVRVSRGSALVQGVSKVAASTEQLNRIFALVLSKLEITPPQSFGFNELKEGLLCWPVSDFFDSPICASAV